MNAKWLEPYVWGGTFAIIYAFRPSPMQANNLQELKLEFPNHCNALLGCDSSKDEVVYDINSYKAIQVEFNRPKLKLPANQINDLIDTHYKHIFERLDVPTTIDTGNLFNEQIQIHLNSGRTKNIGALNIDGTWKHKPEKQRHQTLIKEAKEILLDWGFRLPIE